VGVNATRGESSGPAPARTQASGVTETLRIDEELSLARRASAGEESRSVLVLSTVSQRPSAQALRRLTHEFALRDVLEGAWAARPINLGEDEGRPLLTLEDPGGPLLAALVGAPWETRTFLRVAIGLTVSLARVHERGLIHKDVKPGNVLTNPATGDTWLTGFGIATRSLRERSPPDPPQMIAGTLAYMAPEQTGRMNRSVDSRSDLYSLGVTLYEMLTGEVPFAASDPMELVHCHIARPASLANQRNPRIPEQLGAIVAKLLAKPAESRYQTAAGVLADLRQCLSTLEATGHIDSFTLGAADVPERLIIPERLYGRERDIEKLLGAFNGVVADGNLAVVLVSGYSGVGKSSVVNELHKALVPPRGLFASGKFDQHKRDIPYATLAQAFQGLVRMILAQSDCELARWRDAIVGALGPNGKLMTNLIPELELVIGPQPPVPEVPPGDDQNRFQFVFRAFIGVFARPEHPLALFLDDLQWLDAATLKLLETLVTRQEHRHLLLIGAYRDNEVHAAHPLTPALDAIRKSGARVHELELMPLVTEQVTQLVADALRAHPSRGRPLARLVYEKTRGNPFFTIEFLIELAHEGLLALDARAPEWTWDTSAILAKGYTDNVIDLMAAKLTRLSANAQDALKQFACFGNRARFATIALVHGNSADAVEAGLLEALQAGVVLRSNDAYSFLHDRIHEAAYSSIPSGDRVKAHLRIGRLLLSRLTSDAPAEDVFDAVNQLNRAIDLIHDTEEREALCRLNARAGNIARAAIAFANARDYLARAIAVSPFDAWTRCYDETFGIHLVLSECEFLLGDFARADALFEAMLAQARSDIDRAAVYHVRLQLCQVAGRYEEGISVARDGLRLFGVVLPESDAEIQAATEAEFRQVGINLRDRTVGSLIDESEMADPSLLALQNILVNAGPCAFVGKPALYPLITTMGVNLSLCHGNSEVSAFSFGAYAVIVVGLFGDIPNAFEFSELSLRLNEKFGNARLRGSLMLVHGHFVALWKYPFARAIPIQERGFSACLEVGDLAYAGYLAFLNVWQAFEKGDALDYVVAAAAKYAAFARQSNNAAVYQTIRLEQQFALSLQGQTDGPLGMSGPSFDEAESLEVIVKSTFGCGIVLYHIMRQILAFHQGEPGEALAAATAAEPFLGSAMAMAMESTHHLFHGLTLAALAHEASAGERDKYVGLLSEKAAKFARLAHHCPENFGGRRSLLLAEIARLERHDEDAKRFYEDAVRAARANGFVQDEALALELAAKFYEALGVETTARSHFRYSRERYQRWGAHAKVRQLERRLPYLSDRAPPPETSTIGAPVDHLDLGTVVRVLQALASEIELEKWIETLMKLALEDAGAQRGVLLVPVGEGLRPLAEAVTGAYGVKVSMTGATDDSPDLPSSVLRYVARTQETVLMDDASLSRQFSVDPYVIRRRARSVLCLPLVKQTKLAGVLYLENDLAARVFTPSRTALLKLLASQAAMSLENARLYTELQHENDARKRTETALRRSEVYLEEAQRLSHTGSFGWEVSSGALVWSDETYHVTGFDRSTTPTLEDILARCHPEDIQFVQASLDRGVRALGSLDYEHRFLMPDGSVRFVHVLGRPVEGPSGAVEYVGAVMDVTERREAEAALQTAQAELARVMRVTAMGELAASIAHEVNQPLAAISANASAALNWLAATPPMIDDAREALLGVVADSDRGGEIIGRIRTLLSRSPSERGRCDLNAVVSGVIPLVRSQFERHRVALKASLGEGLPAVNGDIVQLQQVLLNLLINAADACRDLGPERRRVLVRTSTDVVEGRPWAAVSVTDTGKGIEPALAERVFDAFFTTKEAGLGMGLSISRSIIARHDGQLIVAPSAGQGATFSFRLPGLA
jgi:predicted ATPase/signal transduction histidine kinase